MREARPCSGVRRTVAVAVAAAFCCFPLSQRTSAFHIHGPVRGGRACRPGTEPKNSVFGRGRGRATVGMKSGEGSAHSPSQAAAAALAIIQIAASGPLALASLPESSPFPSSTSTTLLQSAASTEESLAPPKASPSGPFEEAWSLSNQYYFDRTHKGNDWDAVKQRLSAEIASGKKSEKKATQDMLALLKDKYSRLIGPELYEMLSKYDLIGVGVMLSPDPDGRLVVASPPKAKSQAEKLGVQKGDVVLSINGLDASKMNSFDVTDYLSMYEGKTLTFELQSSDDRGQRKLVELDRTFPSTENAVVYALKDQGKHKIGYARVRDFNAIVAKSLKDALLDLKSGGADEFVLDLRGNSGGAFQSALGVAGLFMDSRPITYIVDGSGQRAEFKTKEEAVVKEEPLVVWVDGLSASSSEVLAGALQDDCRAVLRGERTFGKGLVQAVYGLQDGEGLILTVAQYETPRGKYIHGKGIEPDIRGGLPLKMVSGIVDFDQEQFDAARTKMRACPPMEGSRVDFKGAAGASTSK